MKLELSKPVFLNLKGDIRKPGCLVGIKELPEALIDVPFKDNSAHLSNVNQTLQDAKSIGRAAEVEARVRLTSSVVDGVAEPRAVLEVDMSKVRQLLSPVAFVGAKPQWVTLGNVPEAVELILPGFAEASEDKVE